MGRVKMPTGFDFQFDKAKAALLYLADGNLPEFTKGKACKLLFLTDKLHLVRYGRPTTGDSYSAMEHGPIPSRTLSLLDEIEGTPASPEAIDLSMVFVLDRKFKYPRLRAVQRPDLTALSESDVEALNQIIRQFGSRSFKELRSITHETPAYEKAWSLRRNDKKANPMSFEDFFEEDEEAIVGMFEEMLENCRLREAFPDPAWL
jgi:uncharacterized phage-associated protein